MGTGIRHQKRGPQSRFGKTAIVYFVCLLVNVNLNTYAQFETLLIAIKGFY